MAYAPLVLMHVMPRFAMDKQNTHWTRAKWTTAVLCTRWTGSTAMRMGHFKVKLLNYT